MRALKHENTRRSSYSWSYNTRLEAGADPCEEVKLTTLDHWFDVLIRRDGDFCKFALRPHKENTGIQEVECSTPEDAAKNLKQLGYRDGERLIHFGLEFIGD